MTGHRKSIGFAVVAVMVALPGMTLGQTPATVNISVDATAAGTPLERVWSYHGYDEANYTTTGPGQTLLKTLATAHTAPTYVRTHFLLNTGNGTASLKWGSTNAYTEDAAGSPIYSWTLMDGIMDAITGAGALPFNEIAFMPQAMTTAPLTTPYQNTGIYTLDGGCFYPPKDYTKWGALIRAWATHVNTRYPGVERSWKWELWNEPDIGYWHGTPTDYNRLYDYTENAVHDVLPNAPVGGPAVASAVGPFLTQFLQHCATGTNAVTGQTSTRLDLISFHAKGGAVRTGTPSHVQMNMGHQLTLHRAGFASVAAVAAFRQTPIYITEADPDGCAGCSVAMNPEDAYRNSPAYGAYEVEMMKRTLELESQAGVKVGGLVTWAFTFPGTPYFAGYRALTTNEISLPVLGAFKLLGSLAGTRLPVTSSGALPLAMVSTDNNGVRGQADVDAMATLNGQQIQVLVWNYHDDLIAAVATPVHLTVRVPTVFASRVMVTHIRVDETHGDAYTVWIAQGSPGAPSPTQIAALQQAGEPAALDPAQVVDVTAGVVPLDFGLPRFGISLITLTPALTTGDASVDAPVTADGSVDMSVIADGTIRDVAIESGTSDLGTGGSPGDASPGNADGAAPAVDAAQDSSGPRTDTSTTNDGTTTTPHQNGASGCACAMTGDGLSLPVRGVVLVFVVIGTAVLLAARRRATSRTP